MSSSYFWSMFSYFFCFYFSFFLFCISFLFLFSLFFLFPFFTYFMIFSIIFFAKISGYDLPVSCIYRNPMLSSIYGRIISFFIVSERLYLGTSSPLRCPLFPFGFHCWHLFNLCSLSAWHSRYLFPQEPISSLFILSLRGFVGLHCHSCSLQSHLFFITVGRYLKLPKF